MPGQSVDMSNIRTTGDDIRIAYLGPQASFSHQAALNAFPSVSPECFIPLRSFESIFSTVQRPHDSESDGKDGRSVSYAVLPVENSTNGGVVPVLDLLIKCGVLSNSALYPDVQIVAEHYLQVHHCLFAPRALLKETDHPEGLPDEDKFAYLPSLEAFHITTLYSHPQVWGQCGRFLSANFPTSEVEHLNMGSTSAAATFVAQVSDPNTNNNNARTRIEAPAPSKTGNKAAICSYLAGSQNGLSCLATNIEDEPGKNTTRFFIICNRHLPTTTTSDTTPSSTAIIPPPQDTNTNPTQSIFYKSLITFTIPHTTPGSLASALAVFSKHNFNLTSINSRPSRQRPWHYVFFVECEEERSRHNSNGDGTDGNVQQMFTALSQVTERSILLGSWVNRLRHPA